ncbi:hypothetical protein [Nocardia wallacei]|uniref:hypothetical protein n=1 Tax=Nocardia wallacei TaxID=480035 RepID=UPI0024574481|nr:hypothetical protein [Nocardia wallacei]
MPARTVHQEVSRCLSGPRLAPYLSEACGDAELALALYHWNLQLNAAFQEVLGIVEVVVRNAVDAELRTWNPTRGVDHATGRPYPAEWTELPASPIAGVAAQAVKQARVHATNARAARDPSHARRNAAVCHDDMLAQLSFGLWRKLLPAAAPSKTGLQVLWNNALHRAFPYARPIRSRSGVISADIVVHDRLDRLVSLRNRVAHMEPLLGVQVPARHRDAMRLLGSISPQMRDWCASLSRVAEVNKARPQL